MKFIYRGLALAIAVLMCFGCIFVSAKDSSTEASCPEIFEQEIETLYRFGIIDRDAFDPSSKVTRGDFINTVMHLTGLEDTFSPKNTVFSDVTAEDIRSGAIGAAYDMGIVNGYGDGRFGIDDTITGVQAVKIIVSLLGYDVYADSKGGYPYGYINVASDNGVLMGVTVNDSEICSWNVAAKLIYNALFADILQQDTWPEPGYVTVKGENPMTEWMGILSCEGTLCANKYTALNGEEETEDGRFILCNISECDELKTSEIFDSNGTDAENYLGYPLKIYFKKENSRLVVLTWEFADDVREIYVASKDISPSTSKSILYSYDGNKESRFKLSDSPLVIYNGRVENTNLTDTLLKPSYGGVYLTDTDGNNVYDIVRVEDKEIYFVETVASNGVISDFYGNKSFKLPLNDDDVTIRIHSMGKELSFYDIKENNVLSVMKSNDGKYFDIDVSTIKTKARLNEVGDGFIVIDNERFDVADSAKKAIKKLNPGEKTMFYLTNDYYIAGCGGEKSKASQYGYLIVGGITKTGLKESATLRIYEMNGTINEYKIAERVKYKGVRGNADIEDTPSNVLQMMEVFPSSGGASSKTIFCNGLIKYTLNENNEISVIETPQDNTVQAGGTGLSNDVFSLDYSYHREDRYDAYKNFGLLGGMYMVNDTKALRVPSYDDWRRFYDGEKTLGDIERLIYFFSPENDWKNDYKVYDCDVYDVADDRSCAVMVEQFSAEAVTVPKLDLFLVEKFTEKFDSEGVPGKFIYGCYEGKYDSFKVSDSLPKEKYNVHPGDILRVALNAYGEITDIYKIFTLDGENKGNYMKNGYLMCGDEYDVWGNTGERENSATFDAYIHEEGQYNYTSNWNRLHTVMHGRVTQIAGSAFFVNFGFREGDESNSIAERLVVAYKNPYVYYFDEVTETAKVISRYSIDTSNPNQTAVIRNRYYDNYETIIYNRKDDISDVYWVGPFDN